MGHQHKPTPQRVADLGPLPLPWLNTLVTIVTPTIGRKELKRCIESVRNQTWANIEHLIVADGCDVPEARISLGRNWTTARTGPGAYAVNVGWLLAKGVYIYTLPDDDWIEPDCIEQFIHSIGFHDFAWSQVEFATPAGDHCFGRPVNSWISGSGDMINGNIATPDQFFHHRLLQFNMYFPSGKWESDKPGHDIDLLSGWKQAGASGIFVDKLLHHHTVNH